MGDVIVILAGFFPLIGGLPAPPAHNQAALISCSSKQIFQLDSSGRQFSSNVLSNDMWREHCLNSRARNSSGRSAVAYTAERASPAHTLRIAATTNNQAVQKPKP